MSLNEHPIINTEFDKNEALKLERKEKTGSHRFLQLIRDNHLGMRASDHSFIASPMSFTAWHMASDQFQLAKETAKTVAQVFSKVAENTVFLSHALSDFNQSNSLLYKLKKYIQVKTKASHLNLSRQDFLLDRKKQWRLVESNSIAAGMGPFNESLIAAQKQLPDNQGVDYAQNNATRFQSEAMFNAAKKQNDRVHFQPDSQPLIIFVIEEKEDNIFDQSMLAKSLMKRGAKVIFKTLQQLKKELRSDSEVLLLRNHGIVDLFYFRTGYNLEQYNSQPNASRNHEVETDSLVKFRVWIEQHKTTVCPMIKNQIASSKWVQMKLANLTEKELITTFDISRKSAELAQIALNTDYKIPENLGEIEKELFTGNWLLKTQEEGGGNVFDDSATINTLYDESTQYILMKKIDLLPNQYKVKTLRDEQVVFHNEVISELGIFTLGEQNHYGGYLLRSKPVNQLEAGIHRGSGFLDCVALK